MSCFWFQFAVHQGSTTTWLAIGSGVTCGGSHDFYSVHENFKESDHHSIPPGFSHIIGAEYLVAEGTLFLATSEGSLFLSWGTETSVVSEISAGISACKWSPDQEVLVLTTNSDHEGGHMVLMTADWTHVVTEPLNPEDFGEQKPVTVGWGKKETQFHGSEGKEAAKLKAQLTKTVAENDDLRPRISWRGDGQFFAISTVSATSKTRVIRIYDRQGVLQGTSEPVSGLEWSLAWKPSGSLIASTVELPQRREIAFFEMNGLRHGGFLLPFPVEKSVVKELQWNSSSEILLVWVVVSGENGVLTDVIQLWTTGNYHWYLKQTFRYQRGVPESVLTACGWSQTDPYRLYLTSAGGKITVLEWIWDVCRSTDISSTVAVIDGSKVLLTSFSFATVPPPSCRHTLQLDTFINQVFFKSTVDSFRLAVATDSRLLHIFISKKSAPSEVPTLHKTCDLPFGQHPILFWCGGELLAAVEVTLVQGLPTWGVWTFSVHDETQGELESLKSMEFLEEDKNCKLISYFDTPIYDVSGSGNFGLIYLKNGQVVKADLRLEAGSISPISKLPPDCDKIVVDETHQSPSSIGCPILYSFNSNSHKLYRNAIEVSDACTSFILTGDFLLYTTHHHKLVCIPTNIGGKFGASSDERQVERGARLITTVINRTDVVLQLPRGNLEIIHPRALVIAKICTFLREKHYDQAFHLMRKHRINMNLLVDFDLEAFMRDISLFLRQIGHSANLNIFIAELSEENVTATVYRNHFPNIDRLLFPSLPGKSNRVLERIEKALEGSVGEDLFLSKLACHIYKKPQELQKALFKVMELMKSSRVTEADEALKFILYSTNVDELYNVALGTYDFDLVLMVAAKSRKDPKEYIPFLNQFRALQPEAYQKSAIDQHLKLFDKALLHLASMGSEKFSECVELIVTHHLYREALDIFREKSEERSKLLFLYGEFLSKTKKKYGEAALVYDEGGHATEAVENYRKALDWQMAMACAAKANWDEKSMVKSAELMALGLKSANRHSDAAKVLLDFAKNIPAAFGSLLEGRLWPDAFLLLQSRDCGPNSREKFLTALTESTSLIQSQLEEMKTKVDKFQTRLKIARQIKKEKKLNGGAMDDFIDNMSETSSVSERSSMRSSKFSRTSSKNRRKEEKKKRSLREGGPYEDLALLDALSALYRQLQGLVGDVASLLKFLLLFGKIEIGRELQREFGDLLKNFQQRREEIWTVEELSSVLSGRLAGHFFGPDATTSSIVSGLTAQENKEPQPGDLSLSDLALFLPPDFHMANQWSDALIDQLASTSRHSC